MRRDADSLPVTQSMRAAHKVRRARRSNEEHGARGYLGRKQKPWKQQTMRSAA